MCEHPPGFNQVFIRLSGHSFIFLFVLCVDVVLSKTRCFIQHISVRIGESIRGVAQLVARTAGGREVAGSSPVTPTKDYSYFP